MTKVAVLDDWQNLARSSADWSALEKRASVAFFPDATKGIDALAARLADFEIILAMRERTAFPSALVERLPKLRMFGLTGARAASIDTAAMMARGITVCYTGGGRAGTNTAELTLGLLLAAVRRIPAGDAAIRAGRFQEGVAAGFDLAGKTLGIIGLGRIGRLMARYAQALDMRVIAWSQNLTAEAARAAGATFVAKDALLSDADVVTLHLVLSDRTRGIVGAGDLARMKPGAVLINTSRGPLVDEQALVDALRAGRLIAGLDVFDEEPLPAGHPLRALPNTVLTPHLGYGTTETFQEFYRQSVENAVAFLDGKPVRAMAPAAR
ncbi:MAG: D-2-hydroxyacid dehydrogenase family protein [Alphaproteobacteria bacterium]|nr:D-2-hydroxyacid dehydrogenase family protein [Alphaproteobacteria bacterium]